MHCEFRIWIQEQQRLAVMVSLLCMMTGRESLNLEEALEEENPYGPGVQQQGAAERSADVACIPPPGTRANTKAKQSATSSKDAPEVGKFFMPTTNPGYQPTNLKCAPE